MQQQLVKQMYIHWWKDGCVSVFIDPIKPYLYLSYSILIEPFADATRQMAFTYVLYSFYLRESNSAKGQHFRRPIKLYLKKFTVKYRL